MVAWNLTRRCNLECAHCYISAGPHESAQSELSTAECLRIATEILALNSAPLFILSGGEPLLRTDLERIAEHSASRGATVVIGTNGTLLDDRRITSLKNAGVTGFAVSVDSIEPRRHDNFRRGHGAFEATAAAIGRLRAQRLDFIVQTTITKGNRSELPTLVEWAATQGAVSFNAYFLVPTGRGARLSDLTAQEYEQVLTELVHLHRQYQGRMMIRAKCAPHFMRLVHAIAPDSTILNYETRCPCGLQYCRITPDGKLTPCPYIPTAAGDLRRDHFARLWKEAPLFRELRGGSLGGRCGRCEYRGMCGGCRARALATTGDILADDPSCVYQPKTETPAPVIPRARPVSYGGVSTPHTLPWSVEAEARLSRIPSFVRAVVASRIEEYARKHGQTEVTLNLMREVRQSMPVDFSKKRPFFLDEE